MLLKPMAPYERLMDGQQPSAPEPYQHHKPLEAQHAGKTLDCFQT